MTPQEAETLTRLRTDNEHLRKQNRALAESVEDLQQQLKHMTDSRNDWKSAAHDALIKMEMMNHV